MSLCSCPTNGLVSTIAPDPHGCILHLRMTSSHVFIRCILSACTSVTVSSYQHPCILHLQPTISHVCNNCTLPFPTSLTIASYQQSYHSVNLCLRTSNNVCYNCTQLTGMLGTVALDKRACLFKLHSASVHVCSTFSQPAARHHCHRVSRHIYHCACLIMWH